MAERKWITQAELARELSTPERKVTLQVINHWVQRKQIKTKIDKRYGFVLVDKSTLKVRPFTGRKMKS